MPYRQQVKEEISMGMTPMPHMNAKDERVQCFLEISFIDAVVLPLWEHLAMLFPSLQPCLAQIVANRNGFQKLTARRTLSIREARKLPRTLNNQAVCMGRCTSVVISNCATAPEAWFGVQERRTAYRSMDHLNLPCRNCLQPSHGSDIPEWQQRSTTIADR